MQFRCLVSQGCKLKIPQFEVNDIDMFEVEIFVVFVITFCYWGFLSQTSKMFVRLLIEKGNVIIEQNCLSHWRYEY